MANKSKKYTQAVAKIDRTKLYDSKEALDLVAEIASAKFDETVEAHIKLGVDGRHADQQVRGAIVLPHGTGKTKRVLVFAKGEKATEAQAAGADFVGAEDLVQKIQKENWFDFDVVAVSYTHLDVYKRQNQAKSQAEKIAIEDARYVFPNACETKMVFTINVRSLYNFFEHRCCERAQWEIRELATQILKQVKEVAPILFKNCGPKCVKGPCTEGNMTCGKIVSIKEKFKNL